MDIPNLWNEDTDENIVRSWLLGSTDGQTYSINNHFLPKIKTPLLYGNFDCIEAEWDEIIGGVCYGMHIGDPAFEKRVEEVVTGLNDFIKRINENPTKYFPNKEGYYFTGTDDGGCYSVTSTTYSTQEECYMAMMNCAIEKMKWNVEWEDVLDGQQQHDVKGILKSDETNGGYIGYEAKFYPHKIVHTSYSGTYTYEIHRSENKKTY